MAITTDSYYDIINGGITLDKIGLSKTINNYSINEIKEMTYCGAIEDKVRYFVKGLPVGSNSTMVGYSQNVSGGCPYIARYIGSQFQYPQLDIGGTDEYNYPDGLPHSVLWLYRETGTYDGVITPDNQSNYKIITEWDAPKYTMYISYDNTKSNIFLIEDNISVVYNTNRGTAGNVQINAIGKPYIIFEHDDKVFFMHAFYFTLLTTTAFTYINNSYQSSCMCAFRSYTNSEEYGTAVTMADLCNGDNLDNPANLPAQVSVVNYYNYTGHTMVDGVGAYITIGSNTGLGVRGISMRYFYTKIENMLLNIAGAGLYFNVGNTEYKPIISGGWVIDYTDDLEKTSDIDNYSGSTKHTVAPTPPAPSIPSGDIETEMPLAYIGGTAGMVDFIKINAAGLASADDIADAISRFDITTIGKDLLRNFVAFKCYAVLDIDDSVVRDIKVSGHTLKDENDHALQGEYIGGVSPVDFSAGRIEPLYNDYRDFAPYTRIQMYVPFCGWFDLPSWCMGKEITGTMFTDLYNGTVKAVIYASRTVVAEVGGCCAFDIPFAAESTGMKAGAVISSALSTIAMTGATIAAPNIATGIAAVSSAANFISAANSNGTTLKGVMGDGSNTNGLLHVYIKTTRPNSPDGNKEIPERYKHENGIPCFKQLTLTAGDGFTQIIDANIEGEMTDREKQMIIDGFRHGLIL